MEKSRVKTVGYQWICPKCENVNTDTRRSFVCCTHCGLTQDSLQNLLIITKPRDNDIVNDTQQGFELLCNWSANIAMLPLEDWLKAIKLAEVKTQPDVKVQLLKALIKKSIPVKRAVRQIQAKALRDLQLDLEKKGQL